MSRLFGTDGIRGTAGTYPLDAETVARVGAALVRALPHPASGQPPRLVVGRDTRESGEWIERALARGVRVRGRGARRAPALCRRRPRLPTRAAHFDAGLVISASHNPYRGQRHQGVLGRRREVHARRSRRQVEAIVADTVAGPSPVQTMPALERGRSRRRVHRAPARGAAGSRRASARMRLVVDCANGATTTVAPRLFRDLGFDVTLVGAHPTGGTSIATAARRIPNGCRRGCARGGDGSAWPSTATAIALSSSIADGRIVDGDAVMLMCARADEARGTLAGNALVATVMSNIGLELALRDEAASSSSGARSATST